VKSFLGFESGKKEKRNVGGGGRGRENYNPQWGEEGLVLGAKKSETRSWETVKGEGKILAYEGEPSLQYKKGKKGTHMRPRGKQAKQCV